MQKMTQSDYKRATTQTAANLRTVAESLSTRGLSRLSLDIIGNKRKMLGGITRTQVLDGGIPRAGYEGHKPLP